MEKVYNEAADESSRTRCEDISRQYGLHLTKVRHFFVSNGTAKRLVLIILEFILAPGKLVPISRNQLQNPSFWWWQKVGETFLAFGLSSSWSE
jgi:hypothetical protein